MGVGRVVLAAGLLLRVGLLGTLLGACGPLNAGPPDRAWTELRSKHFLVQSDLREPELEALGFELERSYAALHSYLVPGGSDLPGESRVVALASAPDFQLIQSTPYAAFFRSRESLVGTSSEIIFSVQNRAQAMEVFRHELVHRFVAHYFPAAPLWVNEGLAQFLSSATIDDNEVVVGLPLRNYEWDGWQWKRWRTPFADVWPRLDDLRQRTGELDSSEYAGAWALIHTLLLGDPRHRTAFGGYMTELHDAQLNEPAAFAKHVDAAMLAELRAAYQGFPKRGNLPTETVKLRSLTPEVSLRALTRAQAYVLWGELRADDSVQDALALKDADEAIRSDPTAAAGYVLRGVRHYRAKDGKQALLALRRAVELEPNKREAVRALAALLLELEGATPEAAALMGHLQSLARGADDYNALARWALAEQQPERAFGLALQATEVDPGCATCFVTAALAKASLLDFTTAARHARMAVNLSAERANPVMQATLKSFDAARLQLAAGAAGTKGLAKEVVDAVVRANYGSLRACTGHALTSKSGAERRLRVRVAIEANGSVSQTEPLESNFDDQASVPCILEKLRAVRFPPPSAGATSLNLALGFRR